MPATDLRILTANHGTAFLPPSVKAHVLNSHPRNVSDIEKQLLQSEQNRQAASEQLRKESEATRQGQLRQESMKRQEAAGILLGHLLMVEIMMSSIVHRYAHQVYSTIEKRGLLRHNIKRQVNQLHTVAIDLMSRCNAHDRTYVEQYARDIYPSLAKSYIEAGGTITIKLQAQFHTQHAQRIDLIYFATKNALDKMRVSSSDLVTDIFMITMLTHTGIEFYDLICQKSDRLMQGFGRITRVKSHHNERMLCAAKELLRLFGCSEQMPEEVACHPLTLTAQFQRELTSIGLLDTIEHSLVALRMDYVEFVIASLRMKLSDGRLPVADVRALLSRVGIMSNIRRLLTEIADIPLPQSEEWDVIDLAQSLPDCAPESAIATFRRLCLDNRELLPEAEDEIIVRLRLLRQEARSNGGVLPAGTLKHLFAEMGTKKAVQEFLTCGGKELERSVKAVRGMKVGELKER